MYPCILYMKAIHGGKAKNDKIDAHKIATLLRGGAFPTAYVFRAGRPSIGVWCRALELRTPQSEMKSDAPGLGQLFISALPCSAVGERSALLTQGGLIGVRQPCHPRVSRRQVTR
jgi:hypothetical protein